MTGGTGTGITLYSRWQQGQAEGWVKTELNGASWHGGAGAATGHGGPNAAGRWIVRIPEAAMPSGYIAPDQWRRLAGPAAGWTLQPGDVLAKGHGLPEAEDGISTILNTVLECFVVESVRDNRRGAKALRHLRAEGGRLRWTV